MYKLLILLLAMLFSCKIASAGIISTFTYDSDKITLDLVEDSDSVTTTLIGYNGLSQTIWQGKVYLPSQLVHYVVPTNATNFSLDVSCSNNTTYQAAAPSISQDQLVETGKTWWYTNYYTPMKQYEYGFSIQEPCELDGEMWHPVKIVLIGGKDNPAYAEDGDIDWHVVEEDITVCHVRQQGNIMYVHPEIQVPYGILYSYMHEPLVNYIRANSGKNLSFDYSINLCPAVGDTITYGTDECYSTWEVTDLVEEHNSGIDYQTYKINYIDTNQERYSFDFEISSSYTIIPQIGWINPEQDFISTLFFAPGGICQVATTTFDTAPQLRYVTDANGEVIYTDLGGLKLWQLPLSSADVEVDTETFEEQWFTIDGRRVNKPDKAGVYIHRQGSKVSKVNVH